MALPAADRHTLCLPCDSTNVCSVLLVTQAFTSWILVHHLVYGRVNMLIWNGGSVWPAPPHADPILKPPRRGTLQPHLGEPKRLDL